MHSTWTLDGLDVDGSWPAVIGERSVRQSLLGILLTRPGERLMRPEFGAGLEQFIHQPNSAATRTRIAQAIREAVERWEPRISLDEVEVLTAEQHPGRVHIAIHYRLRQGGAPSSTSLSLELAG